ncbi:hypothetical protein MPTK1_3g13260 [Marchantia polymorpha subsp. ruderalis]|uniref:Fungal lipase-type domain-containing protein n=2 Tax=Marchantia polymorpha TaxID=3197 RepID=A0AAF6B0C7_MARPO|nr:hypothetical protein MARPO_0050s0118 [Marchantia polymorpha]BBN05461.1 hypothetical protein Mp_3g13260 [Marchantia polymorpha subsp. ruderalis]|eukprot:PTQ38674.1 hypothetical protein MARPO_0050s0118 [Marchantia polymorpha]
MATMDPSKTKEYMLVDPKTGDGHRGSLKFMYDLARGKGKWKDSRTVSELALDEDETKDDTTWQQRMSLLLCKLMWTIHGPLTAFGAGLVYILNLIDANDGVFKTLGRALVNRSALVVRDPKSAEHKTLFAIADPRFDLQVHAPPRPRTLNAAPSAVFFPGEDYGALGTADVSIMAAKLAYENQAFIERVVTETWKMNFVGFYSCWNQFTGRSGTQFFIFTDQPKDAKAIVVAWRGTESFNGYDWSTDFDFSWYKLQGMGLVHIGFLEALGLVDRNSMESFTKLETNCAKGRGKDSKSGLSAEVRRNRQLAYDKATAVVKELMAANPEAKLFVTGHSLGGSLAALYTTLLFHSNEEAATSKLGALYTFGQPRVGGLDFSQYMISKIGENRYWRIVYLNDLVPRIPFDDRLFQFKHSGLCYYFDARYGGKTLAEAPNPNFFSLTSIVTDRVVALYELVRSPFFRWLYGPEYAENFVTFIVRVLGIVVPGISCHFLNNYVNAVRLGPSPLVAKLHEEVHEIESWWSKKFPWFSRSRKTQ